MVLPDQKYYCEAKKATLLIVCTPACFPEQHEEVEKILRGLSKDNIAFTMGAGDIYKAGENAL